MRRLPAGRMSVAVLAGACGLAALAMGCPGAAVLDIRAATAAPHVASARPSPTPRATPEATPAPTPAPTPEATPAPAPTAAPTPAPHAPRTDPAPLRPSIQALTIPTFIVVPVGTPPPVPRIVSPGGVIAPYSPLPTPGTATPAPATTPTAAPSTALPAAAAASSGAPPSTGGGGTGPTALLGIVLAAAFIAVTELRERRGPG